MFNQDGTYNKTLWQNGDVITSAKMNKIEETLETINDNDISRHAEATTRMNGLESAIQANKTASDSAIASINTRLDNIDENGGGSEAVNDDEYIFRCPLATGNVVTDTANLTAFFNECMTKKYTNILIPKGVYKINNGFDLTGLKYGAIISAFGAIFEVDSGSDIDYVIRLQRVSDYWAARRLTIQGLEIKGKHNALIGIEINGVLEFCLQQVRIHDCKVGLAVEGSYYGEVTNETIIEGCLIAIQHRNNGSSTSEVNSIDYHNVKISSGAGALYVRKQWYPINEGESDDDYTQRCYTNGVYQVGVQIECTNWMTKFYGLVIEGVDLGYYHCKHSTGGYHSHFVIEKNYFEAIKISPIDIRPIAGQVTAKIIDNHYYDTCPIKVGDGTYEILNNTRFGYTIPVETYITMEVSVVITDATEIIPKKSVSHVLVKKYSRPLERYLGVKLTKFGLSANSLKAFEEANRIELGTDGTMYPIYSSTNQNIVMDRDKGVILKSPNGTNYLIRVKDDGSLYTVEPNSKVEWLTSELRGCFEAKDYVKLLENNSPLLKEGVQQFISYPLYEYVILSDGVPLVTHQRKVGITTCKEFYEAQDKSIFSFLIYDKISDSSYRVDASNGVAFWNFKGNKYSKTIKAIGTLAERPADPDVDDFLYYAGDEDVYYRWNNTTKQYIATTTF